MISILKLTIWGREYSLPVKYDCYEGESITEEQIASLESFEKHPDWLEKSKKMVEAYCASKVLQDKENDKKDNVFSYIKPEYVFVKREEISPRVLLVCKYRYDLEHGLAIVFSEDGKISVGAQDVILKPKTEAIEVQEEI